MSASVLLILVLIRHYLWPFVPVEHQADVWNICGALVIVALLAGRAGAFCRPGVTRFIAIWWLIEESMVAGCSGLYIFHPWFVPAGQPQCQSLLGYAAGTINLTHLGVLMAAIGAFWLWEQRK